MEGNIEEKKRKNIKTRAKGNIEKIETRVEGITIIRVIWILASDTALIQYLSSKPIFLPILRRQCSLVEGNLEEKTNLLRLR